MLQQLTMTMNVAIVIGSLYMKNSFAQEYKAFLIPWTGGAFAATGPLPLPHK
jgi:hypothetical protein